MSIALISLAETRRRYPDFCRRAVGGNRTYSIHTVVWHFKNYGFEQQSWAFASDLLRTCFGSAIDLVQILTRPSPVSEQGNTVQQRINSGCLYMQRRRQYEAGTNSVGI
ncbi:hypothetical protein K2F45_15620 [Sphingobacterium siyangense]|uniref:hypothetical protein n=1 Tax=Sphingobacterium siyangense TaxID=459529 RepID=UPI00200CF3B3|nr:hypothetical protein [Sphingobacterium siyangense]UQA73253.1 hypothetical protein K2F45_15620 [Sphingobacterium siyangense]